jgi:hypothetical protein
MAEGEVNGLFPTPSRRALLRAIDEGGGRIYFEAGIVWDDGRGRKETAVVTTFLKHEWVRALKPGEPRGPSEYKTRVYYRLTPFGRTAMKGPQR